jgi:hypothetical protein
LVIYALALALAIAIAFAPGAARSGVYSTDKTEPAGPRWTNDRHHEQGLIVRPDCVALPPGASADYVPGRDAWGRPVVPAEPPKGFNDSLPIGVDLDIDLGTKHVAGKDIDLHGGYLHFEPSTGDLSLNGRTWRRDCLPSSK